MDTVSVIIPIYNAEDYLHCSVESVMNQSYHSLEILLVDDGSTDSSGIICDDLARKDFRIRVFHQPNKGLGMARNVGLDNAIGEWIFFLDSDDFLHPEAIASLLSCVGPDINCASVSFSMDYVSNNDIILPKSEKDLCLLNPVLIPSELLIKELIKFKGIPLLRSSVVWGKLYSRELISDIRFRNLYSIEDRDFNLKVYLRTQHVLFIDNKYYYYCQTPDSIIRKKDVKSITKRYYDNTLGYYCLLDSIPYKDEYRSWILQELYKQLVIRRYRLNNSDYAQASIISFCQIVSETWNEFRKSKYIPLKCKILFSILWRNPWLMSFLMKITHN